MLGRCSTNTYLQLHIYFQRLTRKKVGIGGVSRKKSQGNKPYEKNPISLNAMSVTQWAVRSAQASGGADKASAEIEAASGKIEADSIKTERPSAKLERPSAEIKTASAEIEGL